MVLYNEHLNKIIEFTNRFELLINCHLVDFITQDLWNKCLPPALKFELDNVRSEEHCLWNVSNDYPELRSFILSTKSLSLDSQSFVMTTTEFFKYSGFNINCKHNTNTVKSENAKSSFMSKKKLHEVKTLANLIATIAESTNSLIIDAGAGKAYLSTELARTHKIPVLAIDSSSICQKSALNRQQKMSRKDHTPSLVYYTVGKIDDKTDYTEMAKQHFGDPPKNLIITGLHTCGSLADSVMKSFVNTTDIKSLCIVPCCYHLADNCIGTNNCFSRNFRMLAQQSLERCRTKDFTSPSLFYRAVLQVFLCSMGLDNVKIGRGGPTNGFAEYATWALLKTGIKMPSTAVLEEVYQMYAHWKNKFDIFQNIRIQIAPVLEAAIILDRMIFLQKSNQCCKIVLLHLFDPILSPRRYALLAIKSE